MRRDRAWVRDWPIVPDQGGSAMNPELAEPGPVPAPIVDGANGEEATRAMPLSDAGFTSLEGVLAGPMEVGPFLRIAIALASALGKVHQHRIVPKDTKPPTLLVNPVTA